ncbi:PREDICTED: probable RNA helicase SDE3 [Amphimedon queenslandica]|uniref:Death domain-containing protein n=1 Tax=Amphimedon queenslandica TaxID=400682 RepID=A0AAN0JQ04_AMPQE|nr:PREDICTED: probable RNA helicase SDE3 [Amphimedon queenslandica]|eukprot:XP_019858896.1 PREDICTED: probable RNA helicase SDE3 [Amphimedon queenslandica]
MAVAGTNLSFETDFKDHLDTRGLTFDDLRAHQCTNIVLLKLSEDLDNWDTAGLYLEITLPEVKAIKVNNSSEESRRVALLNKWKQKNGDDATYYNLISGLHDANRIDIADQALDYLKESIIEIRRQQEIARRKEEERQKEERRQQEIARQKEEERQKEERRQQEIAWRKEEERQKEERRQQEIAQQEEERLKEKRQQEIARQEKEEQLKEKQQQEIELEYKMKENFLTRIKSKVLSKGLDVPDLQVNLRQEDIESVAELIGKDWYTFGKCMKVEESTLDHIKEVGRNKPGRKKKLLEHLIIKKVRFEDIIYGLYNSADEHNPAINGVLEYIFRIRIKKDGQNPRADEKHDKNSKLDEKEEQNQSLKSHPKLRPQYQDPAPPTPLSPSSNAASGIFRQRNPWQAKFEERREVQPNLITRSLSDLKPHNYREHFYSALWFEEDEHIKKLSTKCDGAGKLTIYHHEKVPSFFDQSDDYYYGYISGLSDDKIEYATQASDDVTILKPDGSDICVAFKHNYNFDHLENRMYIVAPDSPELLEAMKYGTAVEGGNEISISAQFTVKYFYFNQLHNAVIKAPEHVLPCLLPEVFSFGQLFLTFDPRHSDFRCIKLDDKLQLKALQMIVSESSSMCKPHPPVILYGPYGTGKTRILARAAFEVMMNGVNKNKCTRILISAHHEISITTFIFAYFGVIGRKYHLPFEVILISRQENKGVYADMYMTTDEFSKKSAYICTMPHVIIITTYTMSLKLHQYLYSPEGFFTHLFLDEAAQVREPEAIIPLALATRDAKIVLAGDHRQVGPNILVLGEEAKKFGLNISLLERLLKRYEDIGSVATRYVTKLSVNYRSHNSLIDLPNLFYENLEINPDKSLQKCSSPTGYSFVSADSRLIEQFDDPDQQWVEACIVLEEVRSYLERMKHINPNFNPRHGVCIITSTRKQLNHIKTMAFRYKEYEIVKKVSFRPSFMIQGYEFQAIFLSLFELVGDDEMNASYVKSLFNPYVFNTVITRAKFHVVAIGSPEEVKQFELDTLSHPDRGGNATKCWHKYLKLCTELGTFYHHIDLSMFKRKKTEVSDPNMEKVK